MTTTATRLQAIPVVSNGHLNCMRTIRNSGSGGYSGPDVQITEEQQLAWWREQVANDSARAWLFALNGTVVGFGLIMYRFDEHHWSPSAGVIEEHRGRGYGKWIVSWLADEATRDGITLYAKAKRSNVAAVETHDVTKWETVGIDNEFIYLRTRA